MQKIPLDMKKCINIPDKSKNSEATYRKQIISSENRDSYATKRLPSFDTTIKGLRYEKFSNSTAINTLN